MYIDVFVFQIMTEFFDSTDLRVPYNWNQISYTAQIEATGSKPILYLNLLTRSGICLQMIAVLQSKSLWKSLFSKCFCFCTILILYCLVFLIRYQSRRIVLFPVHMLFCFYIWFTSHFGYFKVEPKTTIIPTLLHCYISYSPPAEF